MLRNASRRSVNLVVGLSVLVALGGCSRQAPEWTFRDAGGDIRTISDYDQGVKVLCFSNTWCDPCREALEGMQALHDRFADRGVRTVFVSSWEHGDPATYMEAHGYSFGLMLNGTPVAMDHGVDRLPTFCVIGLDGKVLARFEDFDDSTTDKVVRAVEKVMRRFEGRPGAPVAGAE